GCEGCVGRSQKIVLLDDFLVLDCNVDRNITIILGRPFLATRRALIFRYNQESLALKVLRKVRVLHLQPWNSQALVKNSSFQ
ncbi:hypothetical protein HAX54_001082, partial [Datura stramonium]|nr:hypothetical protein [Datura stramonium]